MNSNIHFMDDIHCLSCGYFKEPNEMVCNIYHIKELQPQLLESGN